MNLNNCFISLPYRIIRDDGTDIDLYIPIDMLTVDFRDSNIEYLNRIQFPLVKAILLRASTKSMDVTLHFLRDIDLLSSFANMDISLKETHLYIDKKSGYIVVELK